MQHRKFTSQFYPKVDKIHFKNMHIRTKLNKWVTSEYTTHSWEILIENS